MPKISTDRLSETVASRKIVQTLRVIGFDATKIVASVYQRSGLPDIMGCASNGRFVAIETKIVDTALSPFDYTQKQLACLRRYKRLNAFSVGIAILAYEHTHIVVDTNLDGYLDEEFMSYHDFADWLRATV